MDLSPLVNEAVKVLWWLVPIALLLAFLRSPWFKGLLGEAFVKLAAKFRLPKDSYHPIHNVTILTPDGTTQIDHIFVSCFGIFVLETKHMRGWIFGRENQAQWTQKIFKETFRFQNPLRQNYKHTKALEALLDVAPDLIHSVVVFTGECTFKSPMPPNVTRGGGYVTYIKSFREPVLSETEVREVVARIQTGRIAPSAKSHRQHVRRLKARADPTAVRRCPRCGNILVLRTAKRGVNAGNRFWGCSAYPRCKLTQNFTN